MQFEELQGRVRRELTEINSPLQDDNHTINLICKVGCGVVIAALADDIVQLREGAQRSVDERCRHTYDSIIENLTREQEGYKALQQSIALA